LFDKDSGKKSTQFIHPLLWITLLSNSIRFVKDVEEQFFINRSIEENRILERAI
jgi:hypothetical protein